MGQGYAHVKDLFLSLIVLNHNIKAFSFQELASKQLIAAERLLQRRCCCIVPICVALAHRGD